MFCRVEDKDVVVSVRNAMMKTPIGVQKAVAKKSAPKSSATQKRGNCQKAIPPPRNLPTENSPTSNINVHNFIAFYLIRPVISYQEKPEHLGLRHGWIRLSFNC